jgi:hypothetical protein
MQKIIIGVIVLAAILAGGWYLYSSGIINSENNQDFDTINLVAKVNDEKIYRADLEALKAQIAFQQGSEITSLDQESNSQIETQAINILVSQALLKQAVQQSATTVTQSDVDAQLEAFKSQFADTVALEAELSARNTTLEQLREQIRVELTTQAYVATTLKFDSLIVTNEEIELAYNNAVSANENIPPFDEVQDEIESAILQQKQQILFDKYLEQLRIEAIVEILI